MKYFWQFALRLPNLLSESHILLEHNASPSGMFPMLFFRKQVLGTIYVKLLVALEKISTEILYQIQILCQIKTSDPEILKLCSKINLFCATNVAQVVKIQVKVFSGMRRK